MGDALGCAIVEHLCSDELKEMDRQKEELENETENHALLQNRGDLEMGSSL